MVLRKKIKKIETRSTSFKKAIQIKDKVLTLDERLARLKREIWETKGGFAAILISSRLEKELA